MPAFVPQWQSWVVAMPGVKYWHPGPWQEKFVNLCSGGSNFRMAWLDSQFSSGRIKLRLCYLLILDIKSKQQRKLSDVSPSLTKQDISIILNHSIWRNAMEMKWEKSGDGACLGCLRESWQNWVLWSRWLVPRNKTNNFLFEIMGVSWAEWEQRAGAEWWCSWTWFATKGSSKMAALYQMPYCKKSRGDRFYTDSPNFWKRQKLKTYTILHFFTGVVFPRAAIRNFHKLGSLKWQQCILSQFRRPEVWNQALAGPHSVWSL